MNSQSFDEGNFVRTDLILSDDYSADQRTLQDHLRRVVYAIGDREISSYTLTEIVNGQKWFANQATAGNQATNTRFAFRKVINIIPGDITAGVATNFPHGITTNSQTSFTRIYGVISNQGAVTLTLARPVPFIDPVTVANNIWIEVDATNVIVNTDAASPYPTWDTFYVVLEWLQT